MEEMGTPGLETAGLVDAEVEVIGKRIRALEARQWITYELWMQRWPFERLRGVEALPDKIQQTLAEQAAREAQQYWIGSPIGMLLTYSHAGASMLWWLSRVRVEPGLTKDQARQELTHHNIEEVLDAILTLNGFTKNPTEAGSPDRASLSDGTESSST